MVMLELLLPVMLAVIANSLADVFLNRIQPEFSVQFHWSMRLLRWACIAVALVILGVTHATALTLIAFALFSITAATDFETTYLPPDAFTFGSTALCLLLSFAQSGWLGLRDAVVAQAMCFAVVVFVVAFSDACDSGDIKLAMQFGAAAGSLASVFVGVIGMWLAMMILLVIHVIQHGGSAAISQLRIPLGTVAWAGLLLALLWRAL